MRNNRQQDETDSLNLGRDVKQMQSLFKEIQDTESRNRAQISSAQQRFQQNQENNDIDQFQVKPHMHYQDQNQQAVNEQQRQQITQLENHLQNANKTNEILYKKLNDMDEKLKETNKQLKRVHGEKGWKENQVEDLNYRFHDVAQTHSEFLKNARNHSSTLSKQLEEKDKQIRQLEQQLNERNKQFSIVSVTQENNMDKCIEYDRKIKQLEDENLQLKVKLSSTSQNNDSLLLNKKAEGTLLIEVEHLRADVKRLVKMLKSTTEFKEFGELGEDSGQIRFLKGVNSKSSVDFGAACKCKVSRAGKEEIVDERNLWVPEDAWKFAHNFRLQYDGELTETLIEKLLYEFSKIWSKREQLMINRVKSNCALEASSLRRQLAYNPKYDEHQAKATIARLKRQLKDAYKENRDIHADRHKTNPPGIKWVSETVKMTRKANSQVKKAQDQNRLLREKLQDIEKLKFQDNSEKTLFMEGAQWVARTLQKDCDTLYKEWKQQSQRFPGSDEQVQNIDKAMYDFNQKISGYKANCQKEMLLAQSQVAKIGQTSNSVGLVNDGF